MHCLFVGLGGVGQRHLRNLEAVLGPEVRLSAYRVRGETALLDDRMQVVPGVDLERQFGLQVFRDLDAALAQSPDVVFVTNPTALHVPVAQRAAELGCHLFVEKPLSHDLSGVSKLVQTADYNGCIAYVGYQHRQHPAFRRVQMWLREELVGRVMAVRAEIGEYLPGWHPYEDYRRTYAARSELGGGVVLTQIHEIDLLYALFGLPERVFAIGGHVSSLEIDVEDVSMALLEYRRPDGGLLPVHLHQDYVQRPPSRGIRIIGEAGLIDWSSSGAYLRRHDATGRVVEQHDYADYPRNRLFQDQLSSFLDSVRESKRPEIDLRAGAASVEIALAIRRSLETRQPVSFQAEVAS